MRHLLEQIAKKAGKDNRLLKIADEYTSYLGNWQEGYCWHFALAFQEYAQRGELCAVAIQDKTCWSASHVMLKIGDRLIDSRGGCTEATAKRRHDAWYATKITSKVMPLHECDTADIEPRPCNEVVRRLARRIRKLEN